MKLIFSLLVGFFSFSTASADAIVDPALENFLNGQSLQKYTKVIVMLEVPKTNIPVPYRYQRRAVVDYLQRITVAAAQKFQTVALSTEQSRQDIQVKEIFWINLTMAATVTPTGVRELAKAPGVLAIYTNKKIVYPRSGFIAADDPSKVPYQYGATGLDKVIAEFPKLDGTGVLVGHIDTGVDGNHPALKGKVHQFFDGKKIAPPSDSDSHGTHTAGTILGGNRTNILIGVAPNAKLVSAGFLRDLDEILRGMQWMLDPDGNPATDDAPKMVSNSWRVWHDSGMEVGPLYRAVSSWEAAGIVPVFAGGNEGPRDRTLGHPSQHTHTMSVAATGPDGKPAGFSSRGPGTHEGKEVQKPDIAAPGVDVLSSIPGARYSKLSGTSMATPQVAGAIALLIQANARLTPPQIRDILRNSALPLDGQAAGTWNNVLGFGKMNIYQAVKAVLGAARPARLESFLSGLIPGFNSPNLWHQEPKADALIPFSWDDSTSADLPF
ncbi:MAG: S8 family serine peptidase [Bdellovibrionia bacterium]